MPKQRPSKSERDEDATRLMLAYLCVAQDPAANLSKKVALLDRFGLRDPEIAAVCDCTQVSVRNARLISKKKPSRSAKRPSKPMR